MLETASHRPRIPFRGFIFGNRSDRSSPLKVRYTVGGKWGRKSGRRLAVVRYQSKDRFADYAVAKQLEKHRDGTKTTGGAGEGSGGGAGVGGTRKIGNNCRSCRSEEGQSERGRLVAARGRAICASGKCMLRWQQLRDVIDTTFLPI